MTIALILTILMLTVILADISRFVIPNWLVGLVILLYPIMLFVSPVSVDWGMALLIAFIMFGVGFILFIFKIMGGGDVKLLAAAALWTGRPETLDFLMGVGLLGGALALFLLLVRPLAVYAGSRMKHPPKLPRVLTINEPVPYGVAIATALLLLLWQGKIPGVVL